jgi:hypothetical protein
VDVVGRPLRGRLDHRRRRAVQVDPLRTRNRAGLGIPGAPLEQVEERDFVSDQGAAGARARPRRFLGVALRQSRRTRGAAPVAQPRDQALRHRGRDDRQCRHAATFERSGRRHRRRREVQHHTEPDGRPHLQHRLRAGRGRRAAGEPDPLQPLLSREARFFLENQALFTFGNNSFAPAAQATSDVPILFYSRRIGLAGIARCPFSPEAGGRDGLDSTSLGW